VSRRSRWRCPEQRAALPRINALPHPTSGARLVASLPRPLQVVATTGTISAQPAGECDEAALAEHPDALCDARIFLLVPGVVIAVVPSGAGSKAIELGEWVSTTRTLKGEIALPVTEALPASEPFTRLLSGGVTGCALCHAEEQAHPTIEHGYVSAAYRPVPRTSPTSEGEIGLDSAPSTRHALGAKRPPSGATCSTHCSISEMSSKAPSAARSKPSSIDAPR
jgi:hypothetical protein